MPATTKPGRLKQAHERLSQAVESIVSGDDWQRMLKVASKFHNYSTGVVTYLNCLNPVGQVRTPPDAAAKAGSKRHRDVGVQTTFAAVGSG